MNTQPTRSEWMYATMLRLLPDEFRHEYERDMTEFFVDKLRDIRARSGVVGVTRFWGRTLFDVVGTAAFEHIATLRARTTPGNIARTRTSNSEHRMLHTIVQDVRYAGRTLRKNPIFTVVAIAVVALGTGAVSTIFSVANSVILRPVPGVQNAGEVVTIQRAHADGSGSLSSSYPYYEEVAARSRKLSGVAAWSMVPLSVSSGEQAVSGLGNIVSGNYFTVLGVRPALGRFFQGEETRVRDSYPVVVLSYDFWQRQFAGDSGVLAKQILINGTMFSVIGVAPRRFSGLYPVLRTDAWLPLMMQRALRPGEKLMSGGAAWLELFGRMAPGVSRGEAQLELAAITKQRVANPSSGESGFMHEYPSAALSRISGLPSEATAPVTAFVVVLLVVSGLVLLIASVNVASMLLARAVSRRREIAVRIAMGAGRGRLVSQLLTESVVLFALGGAAGTLLAVYGTRGLQAIDLPVDVPMSLDIAPDFRVLVFTLTTALLTGILFGLAPALR
ncbi:MAG: ABC transporter permease, partial [Gemmatimonadaceae bacterium]